MQLLSVRCIFEIGSGKHLTIHSKILYWNADRKFASMKLSVRWTLQAYITVVIFYNLMNDG